MAVVGIFILFFFEKVTVALTMQASAVAKSFYHLNLTQNRPT